ncbi:hypothetical protein ART_0837 [Arthrobacter sp. PAMC 25486]|uniref:YceI family protein n=1 Tax=Arthrobacter sp. PAMC 25486 TaxID=1494608 RepID=UPI00053609F3|nr:YceI family protein [Arthrobacter sp. PAMC 25486]AIY00436.1 hypothetical protein ART_0837 [Arthrobacter sp. PAMC 25486]
MRKKLIVAGILLVLAVAAIWGGSVIYANVQNSRASGEFTLSPQSPGSNAPSAGAAGSLDAQGLSGTWNIAEGSQAGYRVAEVLNGQNATVVGRTSAVKGEASIDGTSLTAAMVVVDMNGLVTDSDSRDRQFQSIVKTQDFPTSTFTLTQAVDIGAVAGGTASVTAAGELTIAGVTRDVTVSLQAQATSAGVEVQGSIPIIFTDFGVDAPNLGFVKVENSGTIEMLLTLSK